MRQKVIDQIDHSNVDPKNFKSPSFNENKRAGSLVWIGRKPPNPSKVDWNQFKQYLDSKYSQNWSKAVYLYSKKYYRLLENPIELDTFKSHKRNNVLKSLVVLSKYLGRYQHFKNRLDQYGIKPSRKDAFSSFLRILNNSNGDVVNWYNKALEVLRPNEQLLLRFAVITGLRKNEAIQSFNLIIHLHENADLENYYNEKLNCLEHFKFKETFLRRTKNVYISFVPKSLILETANSEPVTYAAIIKRLRRKGLKTRINELRDYYATFMVKHGLIREEVDLLQGRIPPNIFIRHYWSPSFKELRDRTLKAIRLLEQSL
ncbi:MAG: integrase [Candidatus Bathyarchaeota archaeon]|nr:integrase [Candidatus Bathyarchaeota archaeon]MDH5746790.1 integrase [Candidatus Bathyarchaeota archaeon]